MGCAECRDCGEEESQSRSNNLGNNDHDHHQTEVAQLSREEHEALSARRFREHLQGGGRPLPSSSRTGHLGNLHAYPGSTTQPRGYPSDFVSQVYCSPPPLGGTSASMLATASLPATVSGHERVSSLRRPADDGGGFMGGGASPQTTKSVGHLGDDRCGFGMGD